MTPLLARRDDLRIIMSNLSSQSRRDLAALGIDENLASSVASDLIYRYGAVAHWLDDLPVAVFGLMPPAHSWFLASPPFWTMSSVRYCKRWLAETYHDQPFLTVSRNPDAAKWFRVLGFEVQSVEDGKITYVYTG